MRSGYACPAIVRVTVVRCQRAPAGARRVPQGKGLVVPVPRVPELTRGELERLRDRIRDELRTRERVDRPGTTSA